MSFKKQLRQIGCLSLLACGAAGCSKPAEPVNINTSISDQEALQAAQDASESAIRPDAEGFRPLSLKDFLPFPEQPSGWSEANGILQTTGKPKGYLYSRRTWKNMKWRAEFRLVPPEGETDPERLSQCNTGFMLFIQQPHKVWPVSLEVQGKHSEMGELRANGGAKLPSAIDDKEAREKLRKPVGEWNSVEITCKDGVVSCMLNGQLISSCEAGLLTEGAIGLQAENFPVQFRNLRIRSE